MNQDNYDRIQIEALVTERESMIADNKERESKGESLAYNGSDFMELSARFHELLRHV